MILSDPARPGGGLIAAQPYADRLFQYREFRRLTDTGC